MINILGAEFMNWIKQAIEIHKVSVDFFDDFYESEWKGSEGKLIIAIITSFKSSELYIKYLLSSKNVLLLFKDISDEMKTEIVCKQNKGMDIMKHIINFDEALNIFEKVYKKDLGEIKYKYSRLSSNYDELVYKEFNDEINYIEIIRGISNVYDCMETLFLYTADLGFIEEDNDLKAWIERVDEIYSDFYSKFKGSFLEWK